MIELKEAKEIADTFNDKYQRFWNENKIEELSKLYTVTSILEGMKLLSVELNSKTTYT